MAQNGTIEGRLKKIRRELSLIDDDLKSLSSAPGDPKNAGAAPRLKSRELRQKAAAAESKQGSGVSKSADAAGGRLSEQKGADAKKKDERFAEYLSTSFDVSRPMGQERKLQRNQAIMMLVIVLFILFLVLLRMFL